MRQGMEGTQPRSLACWEQHGDQIPQPRQLVQCPQTIFSCDNSNRLLAFLLLLLLLLYMPLSPKEEKATPELPNYLLLLICAFPLFIPKSTLNEETAQMVPWICDSTVSPDQLPAVWSTSGVDPVDSMYSQAGKTGA